MKIGSLRLSLTTYGAGGQPKLHETLPQKSKKRKKKKQINGLKKDLGEDKKLIQILQSLQNYKTP